MTDETVSIGEGFAFFRWHCIRFGAADCMGWNDPHNACGNWWKDDRR